MNPAKIIITWFGSGLSKWAPGTMGSLATLPFAYVVHLYGGYIGLLVFSLSAFVVGTYAIEIYLTEFPDKLDPGEIVIDEVAGQSLLLCLFAPTWQAYLLGFILFRIFDVVKPWPASLADRKIKGALGVIVDDLIAALMALALVIGLFVASGYVKALAFLTPLLNSILYVY